MSPSFLRLNFTDLQEVLKMHFRVTGHQKVVLITTWIVKINRQSLVTTSNRLALQTLMFDNFKFWLL